MVDKKTSRAAEKLYCKKYIIDYICALYAGFVCAICLILLTSIIMNSVPQGRLLGSICILSFAVIPPAFFFIEAFFRKLNFKKFDEVTPLIPESLREKIKCIKYLDHDVTIGGSIFDDSTSEIDWYRVDTAVINGCLYIKIPAGLKSLTSLDTVINKIIVSLERKIGEPSKIELAKRHNLQSYRELKPQSTPMSPLL